MSSNGPVWSFSEARDGDQRSDPASRRRFSDRLGIPSEWATLTQVHQNRVVLAERSGLLGDADAVFTESPGLPVAIFTADCAGVVVAAEEAVGIAHAGWRGAEMRVVDDLIDAMTRRGHHPTSATIGPVIGPCCFEVGPEVADRFPGHGSMTDWDTPSVDLVGVLREQLGEIDVSVVGGCTRHQDRYFSFRRDSTVERMAAVAWLGRT